MIFLYFLLCHTLLFFFFFNDTATTEIYTLSLHDALPICCPPCAGAFHTCHMPVRSEAKYISTFHGRRFGRSEEHTSELQSQSNLVCRLLLEKKKKYTSPITSEHHRYILLTIVCTFYVYLS